MKGLSQKVLDAGIGIVCQFVPFSNSRNANPNAKTDELTLNWRVTFSRNGRKFTADYSQGIGHCPSYKQNAKYTTEYVAAITTEVETGRKAIQLPFNVKPSKTPIHCESSDVIECLIMDSSVLDHPNFESWADDYGYDKDSRKAEATYQECLKQALEMRAIFGHELIEELRTFLSENED